ncbi:TPR repeat protein [Legionella busanensis]|uniref:TPR repeat protein n=1 Tax=Legionella busanensis TaxID=190655 RepID=A0A378KHE9_9GAMM|nr:tetratricopeptide/SEL1-like repeat protein [Legionella busanensis]STX81214.1 TPR repeat protein [Legionella busanensis]
MLNFNLYLSNFQSLIAYQEATFIKGGVEEILKGNYQNYNRLMMIFHSPTFKKQLKLEDSLQQLISVISKQCQQRIKDNNCSHARVLQGCLLGIGCVAIPQSTIHLFDEAIKLNNTYAMNERALIYENREKWAEAIKLYEQAIQLGDVEAINNLAVLYKYDKHEFSNFSRAIQLFDQAIQLGNSNAMVNRAIIHQKGESGTKNLPEAIRLYEQAIQLSNAKAMVNRANMHQEGQGGVRNLPRAIELYEQAIQLESVDAMYNCAVVYSQGEYKDLSKAIKLYEQAIELEDSFAMNNRAIMHLKGEGGPINYPAAIALLERAICHGHVLAQNNLKSIKIDKITAKKLLDYIWNDLVEGQSFTTNTIKILSQYCKEDIITRLKTSSLSTSLSFLKQLKTYPNHSLALVLNDGQTAHQGQEFKTLIAQAKSLLNTRVTFFYEGCKTEEGSSFNIFPMEIKEKIFTFVQPGFKQDKKANDYLPSLNR